MAKTKAELTEEARALGLEIDSKLKIAEIQNLIAVAGSVSLTKGVNEAPQEEVAVDKPLAKAGKRSAKAVAEKEVKEAKEERKKTGEALEEAPKPVAIQARSRAERRGKLFRESLKKVEQDKSYGLDEAIKLTKETSRVKFDATVELHVNLSVDPRHADQNVRDNLVLPSGTGKTIKIAVLSDDEATAKTAGADIYSAEAILADLDKGAINFDILIASPSQMPKLGKYARTLGPRGLMPNPKSGTVSNDVAKAIAEAKAGRVEYRVDSTGIVHLGVGKVSFSEADLKANIEAVFASLRSNKPNSVKGAYIRAIHLSTTMGPSITVDLSALN